MIKLKRLMSILSAVALCASLAACNGETQPEKTSANEIAQTSVQSQNEEVNNEVITVIQTVYAEPETRKETVYNHVALQGAVVVEQDGSTHFKYKKKCELCGYVANSIIGASASSGKLTSSFRCPDCGNNQKTQIETIRQ